MFVAAFASRLAMSPHPLTWLFLMTWIFFFGVARACVSRFMIIWLCSLLCSLVDPRPSDDIPNQASRDPLVWHCLQQLGCCVYWSDASWMQVYRPARNGI